MHGLSGTDSFGVFFVFFFVFQTAIQPTVVGVYNIASRTMLQQPASLRPILFKGTTYSDMFEIQERRSRASADGFQQQASPFFLTRPSRGLAWCLSRL